MTVIESLARFVVDTRVIDLPSEDLAIQRRHLGDSIIAALVGVHAEESRAVRPLYDAGAADRMASMATVIRMTEIDDIHMPSCTTPHSAITPVVLTLARTEPESAAHALDALRIGVDLMTRFGTAAKGPEILYREIWPTYLAAPLACAGASARMIGLNVGQTAQALAIALTLTAGGSGRFRQGLSPRWFMHGTAVRAGYMAARAAQAGFCGDLGLLDRDWLEKTHGAALDTAILLDGLGETSAYPALSIKPYCSAKQAIAATEAFRKLLADGLKVEDIRSITVRVPPAYADMISGQADPKNRSTTFSSVRYQMALAAFALDGLYDVCRDRIIWNDRITDLMGRISVEKQPDLTRHYPQRWPAQIVAESSAGPRQIEIIDATGDPGARFDDAAILDKASRVLDPLVVPGAAAKWLADVDDAVLDSRLLPSLAAKLEQALSI